MRLMYAGATSTSHAATDTASMPAVSSPGCGWYQCGLRGQGSVTGHWRVRIGVELDISLACGPGLRQRPGWVQGEG